MKPKDEISQYEPWEKEKQGKKKSERGGSIPPQTNQKSRIRSRPRSGDQEYLDLYIMAREKDRMEKYGKTLGRRQKDVASSWKEIISLIYQLRKKLPENNEEWIKEIVSEKKEAEIGKRKNPGNMKKMDWEY
ncbi:MAG: hypothetical protein WBC20_00560 [Candidatus Aminicenantaceae bacterium]